MSRTCPVSLIEATRRASNLPRTRMLLAERAALRPRNKAAVERHIDVTRRIYKTA